MRKQINLIFDSFFETLVTGNSSTMSVLTKGQKIELIDTWYAFDPINDEEEKITGHFAVIYYERRANSNSAVLNPE